MTHLAPRRRLPVLLLAGLCHAAGGCAALSWCVAHFAPPRKVEAVYKPPKGRTMLVFVDDYLNPRDCGPVKRDLTERLNEQLIKHGVAGKTVPFRRLVALMAATQDFNELAVSQVGDRLGAQIVLYVHIDKFTLKDSQASPLWKGELRVSVRMVDVEAPRRLWPLDRQEHPLPAVRLPPVQDPSPSYGAQVSRELAERMAERIAELFYDHTVEAEDDPGSGAGGAGWGP